MKGQTSTRGGRDIGDLQWVGGRSGDNWTATYAFESYNSEPLFGYQRDFMDSAADNPAPPGSYPAIGTYTGNGVGGYQPPIGIQIRGQGVPAAGSYRQAAGRTCSGSTYYRPVTYTSSVSGATLGPGCGYDQSPAFQTVKNGNNDFGLCGTIAERFNWDFTLGGAKYHAVRDRPRLTVAGATNCFLGTRLGTTGVGAYAGLKGIPAGQPVSNLNLDHFYGPITLADYQSMSSTVHYDGKSENASASFVLTGDLFELPAGALGLPGLRSDRS